MDASIWVAIITSTCTLIGVVVTVVMGNKKANQNQDRFVNEVNQKLEYNHNVVLYRIDQLEKKQDKHNTLIERMYAAENKLTVMDEKVKVANHRIDDLEARKYLDKED